MTCRKSKPFPLTGYCWSAVAYPQIACRADTRLNTWSRNWGHIPSEIALREDCATGSLDNLHPILCGLILASHCQGAQTAPTPGTAQLVYCAVSNSTSPIAVLRLVHHASRFGSAAISQNCNRTRRDRTGVNILGFSALMPARLSRCPRVGSRFVLAMLSQATSHEYFTYSANRRIDKRMP